VLITRAINCINTSGICHSVSVTVSCASDLHTKRSYTRGCIDEIYSPDYEHEVARNM
jgi:hypothetical protein